MTCYVKTDTMELGIMSPQFLSVIMDEPQTDSNGNKRNETLKTFSSVSKSVKRALESETTIIPIYSNSK